MRYTEEKISVKNLRAWNKVLIEDTGESAQGLLVSEYFLFVGIGELYRFLLISTVCTFLCQQIFFHQCMNLFVFDLLAFICKMLCSTKISGMAGEHRNRETHMGHVLEPPQNFRKIHWGWGDIGVPSIGVTVSKIIKIKIVIIKSQQ